MLGPPRPQPAPAPAPVGRPHPGGCGGGGVPAVRWSGDTSALGGAFPVQWEALVDLPFRALVGGPPGAWCNPLNEGKPVKVSRDGQELPWGLGCALVRRGPEVWTEFGRIPIDRPTPKHTESGKKNRHTT